MRAVDLTTNKGGINRLRVKGAALQDSLYDLVNGYITSARTIKGRPGTRRLYELPAGTAGLVTYEGRLLTFATEQIAGMPDDVDLVVLRSPDGVDRTIVKIHFAKPFLGYLYIVAEFSDGNTYHFWLQDAEAWEASTEYDSGALVEPTTGSTGVVFKAGRAGSAYPPWTAGAPREIGDRIEPADYNGYYYEVVAVTGVNPRSGETEPTWPAQTGALVLENADYDPVLPPVPPPNAPPPNAPPPQTVDRYTNTGRTPTDFRDIE